MDSIGGFHEIETDDKLYQQLVYHHPKYKPKPQTKYKPKPQTTSHDLPFQPLFLCPIPRILKVEFDSLTSPINNSPEYIVSATKSDEEYKDHSLLPLFWCNNKEFDVDGGCDICSGSNFGTDYYLCVHCDNIYHKECVQSPFKIEHPYHPEHSLLLSFRNPNAPVIVCFCCGRTTTCLVYFCTICDVVMHTVCAMKSILLGGFHEVENDGKLFFVYHHPKYQPIPQTQSPTSSDKAANHDHSFQPLFLCPFRRIHPKYSDSLIYPIRYSPLYVGSTLQSDQQDEDHSVLPLFWCNNKEPDVDGGCAVCRDSNFGTGYYLCVLCDKIFHTECVQSPLTIKHPYHPEHFFQLSCRGSNAPHKECSCCGNIAKNMVYCCTICEAFMHTTCAVKSIPFVVDQPKCHDHALTLFPRQASLTCNVCGLLRKNYSTFVCLRCNFVAHNDCMYSPHIIKISRHHHRISYTAFLQSEEWSCGVCRKIVDGDYGAYTCEKCDDYVVHVRCALRKDVWDGVELEGVPEDDDITQDVGPFKIISEGVILHFLHSHHLQLEVSRLCDKSKFCQACVLPICEGNHYICVECGFTIHEICAKYRRRIQHALHPHPLTLNVVSKYGTGNFECDACFRYCGGFVYMCPRKDCTFDLDVRCASVCEPFNFQGHKHPLFLALAPGEKPICHVCRSECLTPLNCIECDFIMCIKCATLPYQAKYKHDRHSLTILWGEEVCEKDWCEVCERNLGDTNTKVFYWCNECCTTLHVECLFGEILYLKLGRCFLDGDEKEFYILGKVTTSRPFCDSCKMRCQGKIFAKDNSITCSLRCAVDFFLLSIDSSTIH
ncbi:Zinc finger PHD-type [Arabidopsis suecica]|uniref:Zinc finger PHD-type n=1 Tax=Arabidopsis suecica TaxID=45249 RepID=A0A8T2HHZ1_ARASU|nr:Zinc finger PHD-type [Arabidopsis suecica]